MTEKEEWGPVIQHCGTRKPAEVWGHFVKIDFRNNDTWQGVLGPDTCKTAGGATPRKGSDTRSSWLWGTSVPHWEVVSYQVRKPRGLTILEKAAQNIPAPEREREGV